MRKGLIAALLLGASLAGAIPAFGQATRLDAIWARSTAGAPITLDGVLDEPAWSHAETKIVRYGYDNGIPGSGYQEEGGRSAKDSTYAVLKFLVVGNQLYLGATVSDSSIGGSKDFNRFDGLLMCMKDHSNANRPAPVSEYLYSWWLPEDSALAVSPGRLPTFRGRWTGCSDPISNCNRPRTADEIAAWDAVTKVHGLSNSDAAADTGYTVEMRFDLGVMGYDVTRAQGDIVDWNISIYDCDWLWPQNLAKFSSNRAWWESPWGNVNWYDEVHIYARPDVTINSGAAPTIPPEVRIANAGTMSPPKIDGDLSDTIWGLAPHFDIRYGDTALRSTYPGAGPFLSGQYQPNVNGGQAAIVDPGDATVRTFFKDDTLYMGFDVRDQYVQYVNLSDRYDGFIVTIDDRVARYRDHNLETRWLTLIVGPDGNVKKLDYLPFLADTLHGARVALKLKPGTMPDTVGVDTDQGYTAELAVDLTKLGYPHGLGDGSLFIGVDLLDGDSFTPSSDSYGNRAWWFREGFDKGRLCCPAWAYLDPNLHVPTDVSEPGRPIRFALLGNYPNPFRILTAIRYQLGGTSKVDLEVYDLQGRLVTQRELGIQQAGEQRVTFTHPALRTGVYLYRLRMTHPTSGARLATLSGKMLFVR